MSISALNFNIIISPKTKFSDAQVLLREFTGKQFSRNEADTVWANVLSHKWNMGERLGRDVGLRVAATDFMENFYQSNEGAKQTFRKKFKLPQFLRKAIRFYFETKGNSINY